MRVRLPGQTLADYAAMAIAPALIMALVGSLIFFLLEVLYSGAYPGNLKWILFFYVFGAVLVARIAMRGDIAARAGLYGLILGLLVWIGLLRFVEYPGESLASAFAWLINLGLVGLVWWCAHKLTRDCTFTDDTDGAAGEGVLQAAGLDESERPQDPQDAGAEEGDKKEPTGWLERYRRYREKQDRKRTPGVWVVYFSLAALPIFGLGQSLIPAEEGARRRYTFWLMGIYVAAGLGLLLTTSFLGLRNYLRQRKLAMPGAMAGVWLGVGAALIVLLLVVGTFLPRPNAEYALVKVGRTGSGERDASAKNVREGNAGEGEGDATGGRNPDNKEGDNRGQGRDGRKDDKGQGDGRNKSEQSGGKSQDQNGGNRGEKRGENRGENQGENKGQNQGDNQDGRRSEDESKSGSGSERRDRNDGSGRDSQTSPSPRAPQWLSGIAPVLKWVVLAALALVVVFVVLRNFLKFLANFTDWAKDLLESLRRLWESLLALFAREKKERPEEAAANAPAAPPAPFTSFTNPFLDGRADQLSLRELIRYSFAALEAWAHERGMGRQKAETPLEFARRLGEESPPLERDAQRVAALYARVVYGRGGPPASSREALERFWDRLTSVTEQPLSA